VTQDNENDPVAGGAVYLPISLGSAPAPATQDERPLFETVRMLDLPRMQRRLIRASARKGADAERRQAAARELAATIERMSRHRPFEGPEVVVLRFAENQSIRPDYAIVGHVVFVGAHLSQSWFDGEESVEALVAIRRALEEFVRSAAPLYEKQPYDDAAPTQL